MWKSDEEWAETKDAFLPVVLEFLGVSSPYVVVDEGQHKLFRIDQTSFVDKRRDQNRASLAQFYARVAGFDATRHFKEERNWGYLTGEDEIIYVDVSGMKVKTNEPFNFDEFIVYKSGALCLPLENPTLAHIAIKSMELAPNSINYLLKKRNLKLGAIEWREATPDPSGEFYHTNVPYVEGLGQRASTIEDQLKEKGLNLTLTGNYIAVGIVSPIEN
jgi:hypothetical protein